ncbi:cytochrome P450 [Streptomyces sp. NBRC 110611]|uniref:cytochrome P450 n=1 Tax=Streptomyces sp. NBRC 110611 TaxID=1621259 RepID=UPI00082D921A|nr:cytochrome P450 [Streptomyces sp. NBRC 110611]GAU68124.1 cytochrome P450 [Streptomyces sp. NBRC 110611]
MHSELPTAPAQEVASHTEPVTLPTERHTGCPFDPPAELTRMREEAPLRRMRFPDGHIGWLATGYTAIRSILSDQRFSSRYELTHYPLADVGELSPAPLGDLTGIDAPEHARYRRLLMGKFTVRRMRRLTERVEQITTEHLDAMERRGGPVDLVEAFAQPIPALMICELLGVPTGGREVFQRHATTLLDQKTTDEEKGAAGTALFETIHELVLAKRTDPTDDLLSDLTAADLTDEELSALGAFLLGAGLDTTANQLALGTFALLSNPEQFAALRDDPGLADQAVEELLRYLSIADPMMRAALEDVEVEGQVIKAGETVICSVQAANRDARRFPEPDRLDLHRKATGHLSFGHGAHQCLGQQLARVEMRVVFPALVTRFPTLRLAVPSEQIPLREQMNIYGVHSLPVTWDQE